MSNYIWQFVINVIGFGIIYCGVQLDLMIVAAIGGIIVSLSYPIAFNH